jgi:hypothetical protein
MSAIPTSLVDLREWLKIPHKEDDAALAASLRASLSAWESATGRNQATMTEEEYMAVRLTVGHLNGFRGDDTVTPEPHPFIQTIRRMHNANAIG